MDKLDLILGETRIEGLDIAQALGHLNHSAKIYLRVIRTFNKAMPALLDELAGVTEHTLAAYAVQVHGAKGSCYGIGAQVCGDAAHALEVAAKEGDWDTVAHDGPLFVAQASQLLEQLRELEARAEGGSAVAEAGADAEAGARAEAGAAAEAGARAGAAVTAEVAAPAGTLDSAALAAVLEAARACDYQSLQALLEGLELPAGQQGAPGPDGLVAWLRDQADGFAYQAIATRLASLLGM
ncbi:MAG: hypothetical protein LBD25_00570 [Coriobacteriales bacterium]|jgi:hypothetical protein|nr:hypothetical protein [Coriobacteriales bacterium]